MNNIWTIEAQGRALISFCNGHDKPYEDDEDFEEAQAYIEDGALQEDLTERTEQQRQESWPPAQDYRIIDRIECSCFVLLSLERKVDAWKSRQTQQA